MKQEKIRVLVADDTLIAREGLKLILESADDIVVVAEAKSSLQAVRMALELSPDVVLMDLTWLGDQTAGWTAIKEIRAKNPKVKIIAITAYEMLISDARKAGADAALFKTFSTVEIVRLIRELSSHT